MKHKLKLILVLMLGLLAASTAVAIDSPDGSGYYVGLNLGYANTHFDQNSFFSNGINNTTAGFAGRILAGYSFGEYLGLEAGWALFPNSSTTLPNANVNVSRYAIDFLLRPSVMLGEHLSIFAKIGMAYASTVLTYTNQQTSNVQEFRPVYGAGFGYALNHAVSLNLEWYHLVGNTNSLSGYAQSQQVSPGGNYSFVPDLDLFTVGVAYLF